MDSDEVTGSADMLEEIILRLTHERGVGKSICPSEAARAAGAVAGGEWHRFMQPVRQAAVALAHAGRIVILRKGKPVDPDTFKGVYRLTTSEPG